MSDTPSRDDPQTTAALGPRTCPVCAGPFRPTGRQHFCSTRCRKTAWRRRHAPHPEPVAVPAARPQTEHTVYQ